MNTQKDIIYCKLLFIKDYKEKFKREVSNLLSLNINGKAPLIEDRKYLINQLLNAYIEQTNEVPDGAQLNLLANWLLLEDLKNKHPDKVTRQEYPIMNKRQLRIRYKRESNKFPIY